MSRAALTDPQHVARSLLRSSPVSAPTGVAAAEWLVQRQSANTMAVERVPLEGLQSWGFDSASGALTHTSGKFFRIEGLSVTATQGARQAWEQPIINQPEVGILGILARKFGGVLHFLMQAKVEPGNPNGIQLAPTVQATVSNYTRAHKGKEVPYLDYFRTPTRRTVRPIVDVRQSEQGSWFLRKRNRNMVVETTDEVPVLDGFAWLTLGDVHDLLSCGDRVSMSARSVLACLPLATRFRPDSYPLGSPFAEALVDSLIADPADDGTAL
ncbi:MAG: NDP-hexose 2,3-dehydratase family protein, partial [Microlunatus sp.]|nr:NDP-hexose 2,3-dehydratase family protein [Microlunatus sp.]